MKIKSVDEIKEKGKRILVCVDFNVTLTENFTIADDTRIRQSLPTILLLLKKQAVVVLVSHLGRPGGKPDKHLSLIKVCKRLARYLGEKVLFLDKFWESEAVGFLTKVKPGSVVLCENVRFHPGEEQNDPEFAKKLARLGDIFVNDNFGTAHRAHASTVGVSSLLPSYAGLLLKKEIEVLGQALNKPRRPLLVIIGGGKTPEKIKVIEKLLDVSDTVFLGGAIANTFFATWGISVGVSKVDHEMIEMARQVFWKATRVPSRLILPKDVVVTNGEKNTQPFVLPYNQVPASLGIFDIGPQSLIELKSLTQKAKTIIWNGPMGLYEDERFYSGTEKTLEAVAESKAYKIVGGGDTISTIKDDKILRKIDHISTGGGAMLEFIEKGTLPAIEALKNNKLPQKD